MGGAVGSLRISCSATELPRRVVGTTRCYRTPLLAVNASCARACARSAVDSARSVRASSRLHHLSDNGRAVVALEALLVGEDREWRSIASTSGVSPVDVRSFTFAPRAACWWQLGDLMPKSGGAPQITVRDISPNRLATSRRLRPDCWLAWVMAP